MLLDDDVPQAVPGKYLRKSNGGAGLKWRCAAPQAILVCGLGAVVLVTLWLSSHVTRKSLTAQREEIRSVREDVALLQATVAQLVSEKSALDESLRQIRASCAAGVAALSESLGAKVSGVKSEVSDLQTVVQRLKRDADEDTNAGNIQVLQGQVEMLRRMLGLPSSSTAGGGGGAAVSPLRAFPDGNYAHDDPVRQSGGEGDARRSEQFLPGGLPNDRGAPPPFHPDAAPSLSPQFHQPRFPQFEQAEELPDDTRSLPEAERNAARASAIRNEFLDSWNAYRKYAWGHDELCPNTKRHKDWGGAQSHGLALTATDALSSLWLLDLHDEFRAAVELVTQYVDYDQDISVSVFETTIRVVGGLLSAYELSGEVHQELLDTATYVMDKLLFAFNTTTGIPHQTVNLRTHEHWNADWSSGASVLSEFGSIQLELRTLSYHTRDPTYDMKATHLAKILEAKCGPDLLCPTMFDVATAETRSDHVTLGALGDSYFEYLLKQYLLTDRSERKYLVSTERALDAVKTRLFRYSIPSRQGYFGELVDGGLDTKMDHLACFAGGMYALAAASASDDSRAQAYRRVAADITETCYAMYHSQATGIAPEIVDFPGGQDFRPGEAYYLLRPEAVESIYYLWRTTKEEKYRTYQWNIFLHLRKYCKSEVTGAYSGITMVSIVPPEQDDLMQSFWLAETLKYLYLTFVADDVLDLDQWVFNTEAHPLRIRRRDPLDVWREWEAKHGGVLPWYPPTVDGVEDVETENMARERRASGGTLRRVAPVDPLGQDMRSAAEGEVDDDYRGEYDPNDDAARRKRPTRHDRKRRKASQYSRQQPVAQSSDNGLES